MQGAAKRHVKSATHCEQTQQELTTKTAYLLIKLIDPIPNIWIHLK